MSINNKLKHKNVTFVLSKFKSKVMPFSHIKYFALLILLITACSGQKNPKASSTAPKTVVASVQNETFNADKAFDFTQKQVDFGPRVPGTTAHKECAEYMVSTLESFGAKVEVQEFSAKGYDNTLWEGKNIIASYLPQEKDRILLCAHWDSRFIAEQDKNKDLQKTPIDGANDGASGVGVLLEVARQLQIKSPNIGVDIILFDVEDQGAPYYASTSETEDSWCLGSQYWSNEVVKSGYSARWGILLDMVGAGDAVFMKEQISMYYAKQLVNYVWDKAIQMGYGDYFVNKQGGAVTDDHLYVNRIAKIPCIDIIDYDDQRGGFNHTWHTHDDNINNIDRNTLKAVGDVLMAVIYEQ